MKLTDARVKQIKETQFIECEKCGKETNMTLYKTSLGLDPLTLAFATYKKGVFAICPECGALYEADLEMGEFVAKNVKQRYDRLTPNSMHYLQTLPIGKGVEEISALLAEQNK